MTVMTCRVEASSPNMVIGPDLCHDFTSDSAPNVFPFSDYSIYVYFSVINV